MHRDMTSVFKVSGEAGGLEAETLGSLQGAVGSVVSPPDTQVGVLVPRNSEGNYLKMGSLQR